MRENFVVIYSQRVGSTHLAHFLNSVDDVKMLTHGKKWDEKHYYEPLHKIKAKGQALDQFFEENPNTVNGCKVAVKHIKTGIAEFLNKSNTKIIFLQRRSTRNHLLSMMYARESNLWHNFTGNEVPPKISPSEKVINSCIRSYMLTQRKILNFKNFFEGNHWIDAYYEDIVTDDGKKGILSFLGVDWKEKYASIDNEKKLLVKDHSEYFEDYDYLLTRISKIKH
jgi:hypothetical protein